MKIRVLAIFALGIFLKSSDASILIQDSFLTDGNLINSTPEIGGVWTLISGVTPTLSVSSGLLVIANSNGQDATSQFASAQSGDVFAGFDFTLTTVPSDGNGDYIAAFRDGTAASGTYAGRFLVRHASGTAANEFQVGVSNGTSNLTTTGAVTWGSNLMLNTTYRIVLRFDTAGGDDLTLWVNPTSIGDTSITSTDAGSAVATMDGFAFRQDASTHGAAGIDNLIVSTTFVEAVPEPQVLVLMTFGLLALCPAFWRTVRSLCVQ